MPKMVSVQIRKFDAILAKILFLKLILLFMEVVVDKHDFSVQIRTFYAIPSKKHFKGMFATPISILISDWVLHNPTQCLCQTVCTQSQGVACNLLYNPSKNVMKNPISEGFVCNTYATLCQRRLWTTVTQLPFQRGCIQPSCHPNFKGGCAQSSYKCYFRGFVQPPFQKGLWAISIQCPL